MGVEASLVGTKNPCELVNRWAEIDELKEHIKEALNGNGRFLLLKGEAGIGKTRIAYEFSKQCKNNDFKFLWGRCLYHESTDPYIPFIEALGDFIKRDDEKTSRPEDTGYVGLGASAAASSSTEKPVSLVGLGSSPDEPEGISISDEREVMFTKIMDLIKRLSDEQPLLLFFDDLQWIDESSSQLLHFLVRNIIDQRVIIMGAYRPEELKTHGERKPLEILLERTQDEGIVEIMEIDRLGFQPVTEMIRNKLQVSDLPESFLLTIYKETEGNPYYLVEILDSMVEEGVIDPYSYQWNPEQDLRDISIPSSIKDITSRRIERLDDTEKKVLMYAAVIGTEFNFEVLEKAIDMEVLQLLDTCEELENHRMISEKEDGDEEIYRFNHLQLRNTIYENMGKTRKRILNKQIGEAIEDYYDELEDHYYSLSRFFYEGKSYDKAYQYSMKAAEKALNTFAIETAIRYYNTALESLEKSKDIDDKDEKKKSILTQIGKLAYEISATKEAQDALHSLLDLSEELGDQKKKADAHRWIAHTQKDSGEFDVAQDNFKKALEIQKEIGDDKGAADSTRGLGYIFWREGRFEKAIELYHDVIEKAKDLDEKHTLALTYIDIGNIYAQRGQNTKAIEYYERSISPLKEQNGYKNLSRAYNNMGDQYMKMGEWDNAIEHFQKTIETANKIGDKRYIGWGYFNGGEALARNGNLEKAAEYVDRAEKVMKPVREIIGLSSIYRVRSIINRMKGNYQEALSALDTSWDYLEDLDVPFAKAENKYELGRIYMEMDEIDKARKNFEHAKNIFKDLGASQYINKIKDHLSILDK